MNFDKLFLIQDIAGSLKLLKNKSSTSTRNFSFFFHFAKEAAQSLQFERLLFFRFFFQNVIRSFCLFSSISVILTVKTIVLSLAGLKFSQNQFVRCHIRPIRNLKEIKNSQLTLIFRFFLADNIIKRQI